MHGARSTETEGEDHGEETDDGRYVLCMLVLFVSVVR